VTKTLLGQEEKPWGVWRGEQEEKWKMGEHPNCRNWKSDCNQKAFTFHNIPPPQQHNTDPIYRKAQTLERERENKRGEEVEPLPLIPSYNILHNHLHAYIRAAPASAV
jgi:hypothetical protein